MSESASLLVTRALGVDVPHVTRLTLQSGDRAALDAVVDDITATARRKGAQFTGPHSDSPTEHRVPLYARLDGRDRLDDWRYTVYRRRIEIVGHETLAGQLVDEGFPDSVHVAVEVDHVRGTGR